MQENQYLSIVALGETQSPFLKEFAHLAAQYDSRIVKCHIGNQGGCQSLSLLISGAWDILAKLEVKLKALAKKFSFELFFKRINALPSKTPALSYILSIITFENPYAFYYVVQFLSQLNKDTDITEIFVDAYKTRPAQTPMTSLTIKIQLPANTAISDWREAFMLFCDDMNFDAVMEPDKT